MTNSTSPTPEEALASDTLSAEDFRMYLAALECHVTYVCPKRDRVVGKDEAMRALLKHNLASARAISSLSAEKEALERARDQWRQDATARLLTWIDLAPSGLIGPEDQVRVALIAPTLAMLREDADGEYYEADTIDVASAIAKAEAFNNPKVTP